MLIDEKKRILTVLRVIEERNKIRGSFAVDAYDLLVMKSALLGESIHNVGTFGIKCITPDRYLKEPATFIDLFRDVLLGVQTTFNSRCGGKDTCYIDHPFVVLPVHPFPNLKERICVAPNTNIIGNCLNGEVIHKPGTDCHWKQRDFYNDKLNFIKFYLDNIRGYTSSLDRFNYFLSQAMFGDTLLSPMSVFRCLELGGEANAYGVNLNVEKFLENPLWHYNISLMSKNLFSAFTRQYCREFSEGVYIVNKRRVVFPVGGFSRSVSEGVTVLMGDDVSYCGDFGHLDVEIS